jgi:hypothetical protein
MPLSNNPSISPDVQRVLDQIRAGIRRYVWIEGISIALIWICVTFWLALAIDYLPVLAGMNEMPWQARAFVLILISTVFAWIAWRWIFRRAFVRFKDLSMALLLERRYSELDDSLVTTLEASPQELNEHSRLMVDYTQQQAEQLIKHIRSTDVFNWKPLRNAAMIAGALVLTIAVFAFAKNDTFTLAAKRLYFLDDQQWPRRCKLEMVGVRVKRENPVQGIEEIGQVIEFENDTVKVATGASLTLYVRAETSKAEQEDRTSPDLCTVRYWTDDGQRGSQSMKKVGSPQDGYQGFLLDTKPFSGMLSDIHFDVRGGDHRIGPFSIEIVDEPAVMDTKVEAIFPKYLQRTNWYAGTAPSWYQGMQIAIGSNIKIKAESTKDLAAVYVVDPLSKTPTRIQPDDANTFSYDLGTLQETTAVEFYLKDTDGIINEQPHRITINAEKDQVPNVNVRITGIGTAITPNAMIPFSGTIQDDNGTERSWITVDTGVEGHETIVKNFTLGTSGDVTAAIDFLEFQKLDQNAFTLPTGEEQKIALSVKAQDRFDLGSPNIGEGDRYELDVVTDNQLLRLLERDEVDQRKRLEQIMRELNEARDALVRSRSQSAGLSGAAEPGDIKPDSDETNPESPISREESRLLFAQRATLQVEKSTMEISGVAEAFQNIREQLINNRIDNVSRKNRIATKIVLPLEQIVQVDMAVLAERIRILEIELQNLMANPNSNEFSQQANILSEDSLVQMDIVLTRLDQVLAILANFEDQNVLLDQLRQLIKDQESIMSRTRDEKERQEFDSLFNR